MCNCNKKNDDSESLTSSCLSISVQNVLQKYCDAGMKQPVCGHVHGVCQKYWGAGQKQPVSGL